MSEIKKYNIKYYSKEKAKKRDQFFSQKPLFINKGVDTNKIFFDFILEKIKESSHRKISILDLGTGTGYVPEVITKLSKANFQIIGIDLSKDMLARAEETKSDQRIKYKLADNRKLPFKNNSFDIITNKLSTQFNAKEVYRVLKKDGIFVFKEYRKYKGFKEIAEIFKKRFKKTQKLMVDYANELIGLNFREVVLKSYLIKREYKAEEIKEIFSMVDLISNFDDKDMAKIKKLEIQGRISVNSDPFILFTRK